MSPSTRNTGEFQHPAEGFDTLFKLARHRAHAQPDVVGYTYLVDGETEEQRLTYGELDLRARAIAARIQSVCKPGDQVLLLYGSGLDYIVALFACQYAGVIPVPAYPPDPLRSARTLPRLRAIVSDCGATLALGTAESLGWLGWMLPSELGLCLTLATDGWSEWVDLPWVPPETHPDQIALLQYTSGSTADPRGVMVTHRNLWYQFEGVQVDDSDDLVGVNWLPLYHDLGLVGAVLTPLAYRRHTVLMSPLAFVQHPLRWLQAITRYRGTTTGSPNFALDLCVSKFAPADAAGLDLSSLRVLLTGAEPVRADTLNRFTTTFAPYGLRPDVWRPAYGMAEATLGVTWVRHGSQVTWFDFSLRALETDQAVPVTNAGEPTRRLVGCGEVQAGSEVLIVDPASRTALAERQVGEIWVRGPSVALGYWNRPEETEAFFRARLAAPVSGAGYSQAGNRGGSFGEGALAALASVGERGPFLRTGDLGFSHEGQLYPTGRLKEVMVFWGRNVYPQDVEMTTWAAHPLLKENACAAFAVEVGDQEQLVVVQEVARPRKMDLDSVAEAIRQAIHAEHQVLLHALVFIKAGTLPKTSSGKIQRQGARTSFLNQELEVIKQWQFPTALVSGAGYSQAGNKGGSFGEGALASVAPEAPPPYGGGSLDAAALPLYSPKEIRGWLVSRIARHRNLPEDQIDLGVPLTQYVLDSVSAVAIAMDLQQWLGRSLSPTILYDSPSVAVLAERLANPHAFPASNGPTAASVDQLSPSEIDQALAQLLQDMPSDDKVTSEG